jgi:glutathione-regulated potassium-efflux system protein KefB
MSDPSAATGINLIQVLALLAAGVIAVPLFRRAGLGSVLGYLTAGLVVGPFGLKVVTDPHQVLQAAELGVVLFLFIIGLEMEPGRLWSLRKQIFGLGVIQVVACGALLTLVGRAMGFAWPVAFVGGMGFVLTSTAIVVQLLEERGQLASTGGQRIVSVLLLEDLSIVPLLAILALIAPQAGPDSGTSPWLGIGLAVAAVAAVGLVGRWVLNPVFRILAEARAREVMTAAALLVVLGAAVVMQLVGLSMAMGAFIAGVLLSTSSFKHQLEVDVEPFRGILLGLFFLAVGMSLDLKVVADNWPLVLAGVLAFMLVKAAGIYGIARLLGSDNRMAVERAALMAQGGEFAFVLYTTAQASGILDGRLNAIFTATVIISMVLTPFNVLAANRLLPRPAQSLDGIEVANGLRERILMIGFGRFGQIAAQPLIAQGHRLSIIDYDTEMIRVAERFGRKVYYGDGTRLDILHAAGAATAEMILICVDRPEATTAIARLVRDEFPVAKVVARAFDRGHAIELVKLGVAYQMRETFESALTLGGEAVKLMGATDEEAANDVSRVREFDRHRFELQVINGMQAGRQLLISNADEQAREQGVAPPEDPPDPPDPPDDQAGADDTREPIP